MFNRYLPSCTYLILHLGTHANIVFLAIMGLILYFSPAVFAGLTTEAHCRDMAIGPNSAWCIEIAWCNPAAGDHRIWVFGWISNNTICPGGTPTVLNRSSMDGRLNDPALIGSALSDTIPAFQPVATGFLWAGCNGLDLRGAQYFFENCNIVVTPPVTPVPNLCYGPGCYPGQTSAGCSFCSYNWTINATCQGPYTSGNCGGGPFVVTQN